MSTSGKLGGGNADMFRWAKSLKLCGFAYAFLVPSVCNSYHVNFISYRYCTIEALLEVSLKYE